MAPKSKFTKEEIAEAALRIVREKGSDGLTAKAIATRWAPPRGRYSRRSAPWRTSGARSMPQRCGVYDRYAAEGLREEIPFLDFEMQYIRFAREEPELYRLLLPDADAGLQRRRIHAPFSGACPPNAAARLPPYR